MKKALKILIPILILLGLGYWLYLYLFTACCEPPIPAATESTSSAEVSYGWIAA